MRKLLILSIFLLVFFGCVQPAKAAEAPPLTNRVEKRLETNTELLKSIADGVVELQKDFKKHMENH